MHDKNLIEKRLEALVPARDLLSEAMRYTLLGPGKRLRPLLVLASAQTFDIGREQALDPACAIEMVHAYSLIHDDLPCMDNDDLRRGRPTLHRVYPEGIALLAGDALLTEAFGVLARAERIEDSIKGSLIACLAKRAGLAGMAGGQTQDLLATASIPYSSDLLLQMYQQKTGELFSCSLEFGAILGKRDPREMRQIGLALGLAYQIRDDLEDLSSGTDASKATSLSILGAEGSCLLLEQSINTIEQGLRAQPYGASAIAEILKPLFLTEYPPRFHTHYMVHR